MFLGYNKLTSLPPTIGRTTALRSLYLSYNSRLSSLPDTWNTLDLLTTLSVALPSFLSFFSTSSTLPRDLSYCPALNTLPPSFGGMKLSTLYLSNSGFTVMPDSIGNLTTLVTFTIDYNQIVSLSPTFRSASALRGAMSLAHNNLTNLDIASSWVANLTGITQLDLSYNKLTSLPDSFARLMITTLLVDWNRLSGLPDSVASLKNLNRLSATNNKISCLPLEFSLLT